MTAGLAAPKRLDFVSVIYIPGWHPTPVNKLLGNPFAAARKKADDRLMVAVASHLCRTPKACGKRRVGLTLCLAKGQRAWDADALWKSLLDALVACGALKDDSPKWVELRPVEYCRGEKPFTMIVLEDLA